MPSGSHLRRTLARWLSGAPHPSVASATDRLLVFVHLPKSAGTSLNDLLRSVYGNRFLNVSNHREAWADRRPDPKRILCLAGHFPYGWHRELGANGTPDWPREGLFEGREIRYVAIVRDPLERVMSFYRYARKEPKHRHHRVAKEKSPREFFQHLDEIGDAEPWNQQFRMMGGLPDDRFFLAAPLEKIGEFVRVLGAALDWPGELGVPHSNRTESLDRTGFDEALLAEIAERSRDDLALYADVSRRFEAGDFPAFRLAAEKGGGRE